LKNVNRRIPDRSPRKKKRRLVRIWKRPPRLDIRRPR
jgi:hypothetical protein